MAATQRITITLPKDVYEQIKDQATRDIRTIGEEITFLLRLHVPSYKPEGYTPGVLAAYSTPKLKENPTGQTETPTASSSYRQNIIG